ADWHGLQVEPYRGEYRRGGRDRAPQAPEGKGRERDGQRDEVDPAEARLAHEGEIRAPQLQDSVQGRGPQEEPGLRGQVREVLQLGRRGGTGSRSRPRPSRLTSRPMATTAPTLELRGITKAFGSVQALDDVDFEVRSGAVR